MVSYEDTEFPQDGSEYSGGSCLGRVLLTFFILIVLLLPVMIFTQQAMPAHAHISGDCQVSGRFPRSITQWCGLITDYAHETGLHPDLVAALIWQESGGNPDAYSHSGAVGLMQIMPRDGRATRFRCPAGPCFRDRPTIAELKDPTFNVRYGTKMLRDLERKHGDLREALRAYGPMDVGYSYADKVLSLYRRYGAH